MKVRMILLFLLTGMALKAQTPSPENTDPHANIRLSFLLFPFTPLLTLEIKTLGNLTLQAESNFVNTHGLNIKYYIHATMNKSYVFAGTAFVSNKLLRKDLENTLLPYMGGGYAYRLGQSSQWVFDNRIGLGATVNADKNSIYPVLKTGIGRVF